MRILHVDDVHNTLECEFVEIQTVAHIVVGRHSLRVIIDHDRAIAMLANSIQCLYTTPVELNT